MKNQIELIGGPFDGQCHELRAGWGCPDQVALPDDDPEQPHRSIRHWYRIDDMMRGWYVRTEIVKRSR